MLQISVYNAFSMQTLHAFHELDEYFADSKQWYLSLPTRLLDKRIQVPVWVEREDQAQTRSILHDVDQTAAALDIFDVS